MIILLLRHGESEGDLREVHEGIRHATGDTGIHCLRYEQGKRGILYLNNTNHLMIM
ncbi:hypothetical protein [Lachnoclostridium phytofermentans]|uniref:hypothetical protein n=1 Tax=Lachnoclostridium phytofermentans TaxID=66219 RepID=UPI000A79A07A|nr:hypothetical protein [Lachnoclostridium phytofermentans]